MSVQLPESDCQAFTMYNRSAKLYVNFGKYHDINTYTTLGNEAGATKFIRFKVGEASSGYSGHYIVMDEKGHILTFNEGAGYSFALQGAWGSNNVYQKFTMGEINNSEEAQSYIKVAKESLYAQRFIGDNQNQIFIGTSPGAEAQGSFIFAPVPGTQFSIPSLTPQVLANPNPPEQASDIAWISRAVIPRFLIPTEHLMDDDPLSNPYYLLDEGLQWELIYDNGNSTKDPITVSYQQVTGVSKEVMETVYSETSIEMSASVSGALRALDLGLSMSISQTWGWSKTFTSSWQSQQTVESNFVIGPGETGYVYQKNSILRLMPLDMQKDIHLGPIRLNSFKTFSV